MGFFDINPISVWGKHLSAIKRTGVWFAFAAWLMQISVFLTPIFSDQVSVGHGVCVQLADVVEKVNRGHVGAHAAHDHAQHTFQLLKESSPDLLQGVVRESVQESVHDSTHAVTHGAPDESRRLLDRKTAQNSTKIQLEQLITQDHITPPSTAPPSATTATHHATDTAQCGFCLLLGHSVLPPVPDAQLQAVAFFDLAQASFSNTKNQSLSSLRGWIPQSRAPPSLI